ncbi:MAG: nucleotidyltransferase family protein [Candidatus Paceibacterota bacterium]|jgi:hypothetical protein
MGEKIQEIKDKIQPIAESNDIAYAAIFGSVARGEDKPESDIDLLVRFSQPKSLLDFSALNNELNKILGRQVDLVTERALHPIIKRNIQKELVTIYG